MKKITLIASLLLIAMPVLASEPHTILTKTHAVPAPRLMSPFAGEVVLTGKSSLTFEWSTEGDPTRRQYYDFRIYKGRDMLASTLIYKEKITAYKTDVKADLFQNGGVYTWAVRQVYGGGDKSRRNFSSFKITK